MGKNFVSNDNATSLMTAIAGKVNELNGNTGIVEGESFALPYTYDGNALATHIYGMSVQDGTPEPSNPVDIVSSKADFRCVGKNLIPYPYADGASKTSANKTFVINDDGTISITGTASSNTAYYTILNQPMLIKAGTYVFGGSEVGVTGGTGAITVYLRYEGDTSWTSSQDGGVVTLTFNEDTMVTTIGIQISSLKTVTSYTAKPFLMFASVTDTTYEPYKSTDITTDLTLRSIEVSSTDDYNLEKDGHYYISDTVDWNEDCGYVLTRRIKESVIDGSFGVSASTDGHTMTISNLYAVNECINFVSPNNRFKAISGDSVYLADANSKLSDGECIKRNNKYTQGASDYFKNTSMNSVSDWETWLASNPITIYDILATPITETITSEQAQSLLSIRTYDTATMITNTSDVPTEVVLEYGQSTTGTNALTGHNQAYISQELEGLYGAKNLIPYPWYETSSSTRNGVSYTIDGQSVKVNRESSSSSNANFWLYRFGTDFMGLKSGRYILSGSGSEDAIVAFCFYQNSTWVSQINATTSDAVIELDTESTTYNNIGITVFVSKNSNPSNVVVRPMLRLASNTSNTYQPYAKTNKQLTDNVTDINTILEDNKIQNASGESFALVPTSEGNALATHIFGMSTQNGTPTPSSPVDIVSSKADFKCVGKNLISYPWYESSKTANGVTFTSKSDGTITVSTVNTGATANTALTLHARSSGETNDLVLPNGNYILSGCPAGGSDSKYRLAMNITKNGSGLDIAREYGSGVEVTLDGDDFSQTETNVGIYVFIPSGSIITTPITFNPMLRLADVTDNTYEPYKHTDITTDLTLRAIEVTSSDNYNLVRDGKYYISDTVDWSEDDGYVLTRRVGSITLDSDIIATAQGINVGTSNQRFAFFNIINSDSFAIMADKFQSAVGEQTSGNWGIARTNKTGLVFLDSGMNFASASDFKTWLTNNSTTIYFSKATPTTEPLTSEQAQSLLSLKTYDVSTSINAQASPEPAVELEYAKTQTTALALSGHNEALIAQELEGLYGAKNLIPYPYHRESGYSTNGLTVTYDDEGVLTVNKIAGSATAYFALFSNILFPNTEKFLLPNTDYILSVNLENALNTSIYASSLTGVDMVAIRNKTSGYYEARFTTPSEISSLTVALYYGKDIVETNCKVKAMIRLATNTSNTYQPYAMTNKELTDNVHPGHYYGTCATAEDTVKKEAIIPANQRFQLKIGSTISIKFANTNTASNPTLNVNGTGDISIYYNTAAITTGSLWAAGEANKVTTFVYDGTYWSWICHNVDNNSDTKVTQTVTTGNYNYEVLFSQTADNTTRTEAARKNSNLKFNPSTGNLQATQLNGVTIGSDPKFTDTTYNNVSTTAAGLAPKVTDTSKYLKGDGTWATPTNTWTAMVGATSSANGSVGYVNAVPPKDGYNTKYLRADGTWTVPPNDNTDTKVTQTATSTNANYEVLFSATADNTTRTEAAGKDSGLIFNPSTDTLSTKYINHKVLKALTGSGTAGATSTTTPKFTPALWTFNAGVTVANGEVYLIKIPVAGGSYGVWLSLNNGTNYYPVAVSNGKARFQTNYAKDTVIAVTYESAGVCTCYARTGADTTADVTGIFRVLNDYDANTTYSNMSANELTTGTATTARTISAKVLTDWLTGKLSTKVSDNPTFTEASTRANIASGESFATILGKIKKFFTDLKDLAFIAKDGTSSTKYLRGDGTWQAFPTIPTDFVSKANGGTFNGSIVIDLQNGGANNNDAWSGLHIGNNIAKGTAKHSAAYIRLFGHGSYYTDFYAPDATGNRAIILPNKDGTVALTSDIPSSLPANGGTSENISLPRVAESCNNLPSGGKSRMREYAAGANYNLPGNYFYHILESRSQDTNWGTQLALGMTENTVYYRRYASGSWQSWSQLAFTNETLITRSAGTSSVASVIVTHPNLGDDTNRRQMIAYGNGNGAPWFMTIQYGYSYVRAMVSCQDRDRGVKFIDATHFAITSGNWDEVTVCSTLDFSVSTASENMGVDANYTKYPCASDVSAVSAYPNGGNDPATCPIYIHSPNENYRSGIGFHQHGATYCCILYMGADGSLYARWNDGTDRRIIGRSAGISYATGDESGNNIKSSYASSLEITPYGSLSFTYVLRNKNGGALSNGNVVLSSSSRRFKENIAPLTDEEAKKILDVEPVTFDYNKDYDNYTSRKGYKNIGCIAEDVNEIIPELVTEDQDGEIYGINYLEMVPYLLKVVQMQQTEINNLKDELSSLRKSLLNSEE